MIVNLIMLGNKLETRYGMLGAVVGLLLCAVIFMTWVMAIYFITKIGIESLVSVVNYFWFT